MLSAERLRLRRKIGGNEHGRDVGAAVGDIVPQLQQGYPHVAGLAIGLDPADDLVGLAADRQTREDVDAPVRIPCFKLDALHGDRRHLCKKPLQSLCGSLNGFHQFHGVQHLLKMTFPVNMSRTSFSKRAIFNAR